MPHSSLPVNFSYFHLPSCGIIADCKLYFTDNLVNCANLAHLSHNWPMHLGLSRRTDWVGPGHIVAINHDNAQQEIIHSRTQLFHHQVPSSHPPCIILVLNNLIINLMLLDNVISDYCTLNKIKIIITKLNINKGIK